MKKDIISDRYESCDKLIRLICSVTENAKPNSEFEVHDHINDLEIYYFSEGDLFFAFEGNRVNITDGTVIVICDNTLHRPIITAPCRYARQRILINKNIFTRYDTNHMDLYNNLRKKRMLVLNPKTQEENGFDAAAWFMTIKNFYQRKTPYDDFCALITTLSMLIKIDMITGSTQEDMFFPHSEKTARILDYINEHLSESLSYKCLSEKFYMSENNLYKFFKREVGFALPQYIAHRRMMKATSILNAGGTAAQAAIESGFHDYTVFYRSFVREFGINPAQYMKNRSASV